MNINSFNNNLNFSGVYTYRDNMGKTAKSIATQLERELDYRDEISELEDMGVDVVILADPKSSEDRAKVMFITDDDRLYKINGKDYLTTGKTYPYPKAEPEYSTNYDKIIDTARKILSGEIFQTTTKETQSLRQIHETGFHNSVEDFDEFEQDPSYNVDECELAQCFQYDSIE